MKTMIFVFAFSTLAILAVAGCSNTFDGAGRDIEKAGENIQRNF